MARTGNLPLAFFLLLLLLLCTGAHSRLIGSVLASRPTDPLPEDRSTYLRLPSVDACEQTYGFLPCTRSAAGNLFLLLVYGYLMLLGASYLSNGSEMLLEVLGPGIVGGLFLPVLGALPDAILILVSGLSGSKETAQQQVLIGMGLLAGSTVMLLTVLWGSCIVVGKCDFSAESQSLDLQDTKGFSLFGSGISTDVQTSHAARIMVISVIPFIIVQLPNIFQFSRQGDWIILLALILSITLLLTYCLYQIYAPWIMGRRIEYAKYKYMISGILRHAYQKTPIARLLTDDGLPDENAIEQLFRSIDADSNNVISRSELTAVLLGINFDRRSFDNKDIIDEVMRDLDTSHDDNIDLEEFSSGIKRWLRVAKRAVPTVNRYEELVDYFYAITRQEHAMLIEGNADNDDKDDDEEVGKKDPPKCVLIKAISLLLLGTIIAAVVADPLVDVVDNFSYATHIPPFFISFVAMPLATNSSEAVSAIIFASRKKQKTASLTFSEIYGSATMNNTMCLSVFLALVYLRQLTWDFSSEVLIILLVCIVMGLFASFRTSFALWTSFVAFLLYPLSLVIVYVLDNFFGWS